ncbi:N-hydroxyarylamine O-acetyltransferase [Caballeronia temeraria]|uniref:N-hydroxyarylamine O-acetyltransferase n=1 Tax=Caballeronia temeraria TaxID=1777137 RepID=A0A158BTC3_9BURK|nr:arylamine N-acetyltransferase [Caballeronia temeraria]SAK72946.1 N-hydroxyarylamine O-acetyltransferase [Caballeronia temeraria]
MNAHDTSIDLAAYFERIGFSGPARPAPTLDTLRALHLLHPQAIPFENLDVLIGRPVRLDLESVQRKLVTDKRGGYCFEQNRLFRSVLQTLGFRVRSFAGRVLWGREAPDMPPRTHMLLLVDLDEGTFVADVGFGGMTLSAPLVLQTGLEQITPHGAFRLEDASGEPQAYLLQALVNGTWTNVYRFDLDPQYDADYEMANHFVSTYPQSVFVHNLLAARLAPGKRYGLFNRRFSAHDEREGSDHRELDGVAGLRRVLESELGIRLPDSAELDAALARLPNQA